MQLGQPGAGDTPRDAGKSVFRFAYAVTVHVIHSTSVGSLTLSGAMLMMRHESASFIRCWL